MPPEKQPGLEPEVQERLEKLFMCDVSTRYALVYAWGFEHNMIANLDLSNTPYIASKALFRKAHSWYAGDINGENPFSKLPDSILMTSLPEGIPDIKSAESSTAIR